MDSQLLVNIIIVISNVTGVLMTVLRWGLIIYILSSWIPGLRDSSFGEILGKIYEPLLEPFRRFIPPLFGMLDLSPIILFILLQFFMMGLNSIFGQLIEFVVQL